MQEAAKEAVNPQNQQNPHETAPGNDPSSLPQSSRSQEKHWTEKTPEDYARDNLRWVVEQELRKELGVPPKSDPPRFKIEFHRRQLALLEQANHAPRCEHVFTDGRSCGAPRVRKGKLCYAHTLMEEKRPQRFNLPPLEDANAVMLWLMDISRGLLDGSISERTAGLMFYGLQLAMINARHTTFKETDHAEMVRKAPKTRAKPQRTQRDMTEEATGAFTAKDAEVAKKEEQRGLATETPRSEEKALPQRNTEEKANEDFTAEGAEHAEAGPNRKDQESARPAAETQRHGGETRPEPAERPEIAEGTPGLTSAKSIFSGVEAGVG